MDQQNNTSKQEIKKKVLVVSDVDGTLVNDDEVVPQVNIDAIKKFTAMGGDFTIASGRRIKSLEILPGILELATKPILATNGGWGYDYKNKKTIWAEFIDPDNYEPMLREFRKYPDVALGVASMDDEVYHVRRNEFFDKWVNDEQLILRETTCDKLPTNNVLKFSFCGPPETLAKMKRDIDWESINIFPTYSAPFYLECSPTPATKSKAIKRMSDIYGIERDRTIAVGDGLNDLDMLEYAGLGIAVDNAFPQVFDKADARCVSNNKGAIADVIEHYAIPLLLKQ